MMNPITRSGVALLLIATPVVAAAQVERTDVGLQRATVDGIELEYQVRGPSSGEPVVLVHAGVLVDWFVPLLSDSALAGRYRLVSYHRVGYAGSGRIAGPVSIAQQAGHLRALMRRLGIERAHIVGHSSGGNIALQLALDAPQMVHSLTLLEPAVPAAPSGTDRLLSTGASMTRVTERFAAGDRAGAVDGFLRIVAGPSYRGAVERALPGAMEQAERDADVFFGQELPAVRQWSFTREQASRITQPALVVMGEKSPDVSPIWPARQRLLLEWLPRAEPYVLPGATHLLHLENHRAMVDELVAFLARHPMRTR